MMVLLISYDLNGHERPSAYAKVKKLIEENATSLIKPLYSQWLVETDHNPQTWVNALEKVTDKNDALLVLQVRSPYQGLLNEDQWQWLEARV